MQAYREQEILDWAETKGIRSGSSAIRQNDKSFEELIEVRDAIVLGDTENAGCEIGDLYITAVNTADQLGLTMTQCIDLAVNKVTKRKGQMIDGQFVKE